jgi:hypothetical protein
MQGGVNYFRKYGIMQQLEDTNRSYATCTPHLQSLLQSRVPVCRSGVTPQLGPGLRHLPIRLSQPARQQLTELQEICKYKQACAIGKRQKTCGA